MKIIKNVDVVRFLRAIVEFNTESFKSDFMYDIKQFNKACALPEDSLDRYFLWMSRDCGTECATLLNELCETLAYQHYWTNHQSDDVIAYLVKVSHADGPMIIGDLARIEYRSMCRKLKEHSYPVEKVSVLCKAGNECREEEFDYDGWPTQREGLLRAGFTIEEEVLVRDGDRYHASEEWARKEIKSCFEDQAAETFSVYPSLPCFMANKRVKTATVTLHAEDVPGYDRRLRFAYDSDYCVNQEMASEALKTAVREWMSFEPEGKESYNLATIIKSVKPEYLHKYGIFRITDDDYEMEITKEDVCE